MLALHDPSEQLNGPSDLVHYGYLDFKPTTTICFMVELGVMTKGSFTPRGHANSLFKRHEILTCDWPKGSNRSQPLYT
jgi:hypothetical protein